MSGIPYRLLTPKNIAPNKFAATASVAAVPDFSNLKKLNKRNIWLIHGQKDDKNLLWLFERRK